MRLTQFDLERMRPSLRKQIERKAGVAGTAAPSKKKKASNGLLPKEGRVKGAERTLVDGIYFDSKAEAKRYGELKVWHASGELAWFVRQPEFVLEGGIRYRADFMYPCPETGEIVVEDVKGHKTDAFKMKRKMVLDRYDVTIRIVPA